MKFLGLNSPEIFLILVIILSILGPNRIEKGLLLFKRLLKFLLSSEVNFNDDKLNLDLEAKQEKEEPKVSEVKEGEIEAKLIQKKMRKTKNTKK